MRRSSYEDKQYGFSLIELLIVVAALSIIAAFGVFAVRPSTAQTYANAVHSFLTKSRFDAVRLNRPVFVYWNETEGAFESGVGTTDDWCDDTGEVLAQMETRRIDRLTVETELSTRRLVWIPSGQVRACGGQFFRPVIATIRDQRTIREVVIGASGLVEVRTP